MPHEMEKKFNSTANDILDAISHGFRAQVDVKGKLAELYLYKKLNVLEKAGKIRGLEWHDKDGAPDFTLNYQNKLIRLECKNVRSQPTSKPADGFRVEIQKTRNSKDGTNTRSYRKDYFDVLAVCTFNQTNNWEFLFVKATNLELVEQNVDLLKIMQNVPAKAKPPWSEDILESLEP